MTYGKSQAATIIAKESVAINPSTRIGVTCKSVYKRLVAQGVPEVNLIKMWEQEPEPLQFWYDEFYEFTKNTNSYTILKGRK